jgi:hypothetical protein
MLLDLFRVCSEDVQSSWKSEDLTPHYEPLLDCYFSLGNDAMPTNSIASPPARIAKASKPTTKSNPDVFSIKLNRSPIKSNHRYLLIAECLPAMGKRRKKTTLKLEKKYIKFFPLP